MEFTFTYDDLLNAMGLKIGQKVRINNQECVVSKYGDVFYFDYKDSYGYDRFYDPLDIIRKKIKIQIL